MQEQIENARLLLNEARAELMAKPNVTATGIGWKISNGQKTDTLALVCSVESKQAKRDLLESEQIPASIQNIPTDVRVTGLIRALKDPKRKFRPAPGGVSIGHVDVTAGTLGCWVKKNGNYFLLSNNHVLANSNRASKGDAILQPGRYDGGQWPNDRLAELYDFIPIQFESGDSDCKIGRNAAGMLNVLAAAFNRKTRMQAVRILESPENLVDAAIAKPLRKQDVLDEILNLGTINGTAEVELGTAVKKSGRTTGVTTGVIEQIDVSVRVSYGNNKTALFVNQLMAGPMSQGGDSGSAVLNEQNELIGLLYAGSDTITVFNRIQDVFEALQIGLD